MAYILHIYTCISVKLLFKGENNERLIYKPLYLLNPSLSPRPYLRTYIIYYWYSPLLRLFCKMKIKIRIIYKDNRIRPFFVKAPFKPIKYRKKSAELQKNLGDPYYSKLSGIGNGIKACLPHPFSAYAVEYKRRVYFFQGLYKVCTMNIT